MPVAPLVSVIIPTFNRAAWVLEAIASVRAQTYEHVEIIVVDDGSTDGTATLVEPLEHVVFSGQGHAGSAAARNRGLGLAHGELVASLDSDDLWYPDFLERSVPVIEHLDLDFVFANWVRVPAEPSYLDIEAGRGRLERFMRRPHGEWALLDPDEVRRMLLHACPAPSSSLLLRRSSMPDRWNETLRIADDWYLLLEMALHGRCHAAFSTTAMWTKRIDGANKYDGRSAAYIARGLWWHDLDVFRTDFGGLLSRRERARWTWRRAQWRAVLAYLQMRGRDDRGPVSSPARRRPA